MIRRNSLLALLALLAVLISIFALVNAPSTRIGGVAPGAAQETLTRPTIIPADQLVPVETPADGREVAVLTINFEVDEKGEVRAAELRQAVAIRSFAPNVLDRPGDWIVEVVGRETLRYGIVNPLRQNIYPLPGELKGEAGEAAHAATLTVSARLTAELVIPLYLNETDLAATEINIYDERNERVFTTPVERERWQQRGQQ